MWKIDYVNDFNDIFYDEINDNNDLNILSSFKLYHIHHYTSTVTSKYMVYFNERDVFWTISKLRASNFSNSRTIMKTYPKLEQISKFRVSNFSKSRAIIIETYLIYRNFLDIYTHPYRKRWTITKRGTLKREREGLCRKVHKYNVNRNT